LLDEIEKVLDLLYLEMSWLEHIGRTGVIVDDSNAQDLQSHLVP